MEYCNYVKIDSRTLKNNIDTIRSEYVYQNLILDVSNNAFNHGMYLINYLKNRINYLWVNTFQDVLLIRKYNGKIPILYNGIITKDNIYDLLLNDVILVIKNKEILEEILSYKIKDKFSILLKIDLHNYNGIYSKHIINDMIELLENQIHIHLMGIRASITEKEYYDLQYIIQPLKNLDLVILNDENNKVNIQGGNAIKLDKSAYGIREGKKKLSLKKDYSYSKQVFTLNSKITHTASTYNKKKELHLGVIPFGYLDGMMEEIKKVYIKGKYYSVKKIKGDHTIIEIDSSIKVNDVVEISGSNNPLNAYVTIHALMYLGVFGYNLPIVYDDYTLEKVFMY